MTTTGHNFTPYTPQDDVLQSSGLPDKAIELTAASAKLAGHIPPETRNTIRQHMAVINSYYSNLIEGNRTQPHEIRAAQRGEYSKDPTKRDLQLESIAHIQVQQWLEDQNLGADTLFSPDFIQTIHREFYRQVPDSLREIKNQSGEVTDVITPGEWRTKEVVVGRHEPPAAKDVAALMASFCNIYHPGKFIGDKKLIAIMCAHHRLAWIHPFADGNGRVGRLLTDSALKIIGLESYGVWCLSRGLARSSDQYKTLLELADNPRQGDHDGRGLLSQGALVDFCEFMLDTAIDQVSYMSDLTKLDRMLTRIQSYIQARNDGRVQNLGKIKDVAAMILYNAFISGKLERSVAVELCAMPERTARRFLAQLRDEGLLSETSTRSPLYWQIPEHAEPWYFPQLTPGI